MITNFFIPELNNHDVQELSFQQDGATCHTARATIDLLKDTFGDRLISRFGPVNWPLRSCDLTPLDYFLWGYVKSLVYADKPQTLDYLEDNIRRVIADIRPQMLEKVIENWTSRLDYIRASRGSPMLKIIFKMKIGSRVGRNQTTVIRICDRLMQEVSARTIQRRLQQRVLSARRPLLSLPLTQNHRRLHRQWCDERRMWVQKGMTLSLLTTHASVCNNTMVRFESGDTVER
ncbi:putative LOC100569746 [Trichonephila clavipes]|uniref:Putative LOC100569746 n=1 Tax=Trichonephila clavipes TaxID=2585209 RepID=A0A8X6SSE4_TRICX|nr:putative LOC100569746 [Trichonephila clavipes]